MPSISQEQLKILMSDLNPNRVKSRTQSGRSFSYLEGYDVKATLIRVFGFGGFSAEVIDNKVVSEREVEIGKDKKPGWQVSVMSTVRLTIHGGDDSDDTYHPDAVYTESAIATSSQPSLGDALDMAIKSASTDALKRAATYLGTQFGLSLYNDGSTSEVIRRVFAPGQEWPGPEKPLDPGKQQALQESLGAKTEQQMHDEQDVPVDGDGIRVQ